MRMPIRVAALVALLLLAPHVALRPGPATGGGSGEIRFSFPAALAQGEAASDGPAGAPSIARAVPVDSMEVLRAKTRGRFHYLMLGYGLIWVSLGVFLFDLTRKIGRVGSEIHDLKARLDAAEQGRRR